MLKNMVFLFSKPLGWRTISFSVCKMQDDLNANAKFFKNLDASHIKPQINDYELEGTKSKRWNDCAGVLKLFSLKKSDCIKIINLNPKLVEVPVDELKETVDTWLRCEISVERVHNIFRKQPILLEVTADEIKRRVPHLKILFASPDYLSELLTLCPNIMFDDWDEVNSKINFLINEKGIRREKLLKSYALTKPFDFIKLRFEIAEKCGRYILNIKKPHKRVKFEKTNNPGLVAIVDDPDEIFARNMNITLEEYRVYEDLFYSEENDSDEE